MIKVRKGEIELYNEFGLQFELGFHLRNILSHSDYRIQLERPIGYFGIQKHHEIPKKEIDIVIYNDQTKIAVELKVPRSGQTPIQMFKFCEDICFLEQLKIRGFNECYSFVVVDRDDFYKPKRKNNDIYEYFRNNKVIKGDITCPTGKEKGATIRLNNKYVIDWIQINEKIHYYLLSIK